MRARLESIRVSTQSLLNYYWKFVIEECVDYFWVWQFEFSFCTWSYKILLVVIGCHQGLSQCHIAMTTSDSIPCGAIALMAGFYFISIGVNANSNNRGYFAAVFMTRSLQILMHCKHELTSTRERDVFVCVYCDGVEGSLHSGTIFMG